MKIHTKKKAFRAALKANAKAGYINAADGRMVSRGQVGNAMGRDFSPQSGKS